MSKQKWLERLAFKRDELLASLDGISRAGWTTGQASPGWTAKDVLAHMAAWETRVAAHLPDLLADQGMRIAGVEADAFNAEQVALRQDRTPRELLGELADSRQRILEALAGASDDDLTRPRAVPWGQVTIERWALQEIYEHDKDHAAQLRAWRTMYLASGRSLRDTLVDQMAAERAGLLMACLGLDFKTLVSAPVMDEWTIKDILAHVAAWDDTYAARTELALAGREAEISGVGTDERNAELYVQRRDWPLDQALQAALESRRQYMQIFDEVYHDAQLVRPVQLPWLETCIWEFAWWRLRHDRVHTAHLQAWRDAAAPPFAPGPRSLLLAIMDATRDDLARQIERIPPGERETRRVMDDWTAKDLVGHVADWYIFGLKGLQAIQASRPLPYIAGPDVEGVNAQQVAARRGQTWDQAWADYEKIRAEMVRTMDDWDDVQLAREVEYEFEWGRTAYGWIASQTAWHEREHADALRISDTQ